MISVGGTALRHADNERGWSESAWASGGSGCSAYFAKPAWQTDPARRMRTVADLYTHATTGTGLYDVTTGSNQNFDCRDSYMCNAKPGYDAPTGHGTPNGLEAFTNLAP